MKRALAPAVVTVVLLTSTIVATPSSASADVPCTITGYTPTTVVVGLVPVPRRFDVATRGCSEQGWEVVIGDREYSAFSDSPVETFGPRRTADAGPKRVVVTAANDDLVESTRTWEAGFFLKRRTAFRAGTFNASPEPVRKGRQIHLKGKLVIADWTHERYVRAHGRRVRVQFATPSGEYQTVKIVRTGRDGWVRTTVPARFTGVWRLVHGGNSTAGSARTPGDAVVVR